MDVDNDATQRVKPAEGKIQQARKVEGDIRTGSWPTMMVQN